MRRQLVLGLQMTFEGFEFIPATQAGNRIGRDRLFHRNGGLSLRGLEACKEAITCLKFRGGKQPASASLAGNLGLGLSSRLLNLPIKKLKEIVVDPLIAVIFTRAVERNLVVLIGGACIYMGWRLFYAASQEHSKGEFSADLAHVKVSLKRVAPGVFFAAFGAAVVGTSFVQGVKFDQVFDWKPRPAPTPAPNDTAGEFHSEIHLYEFGNSDSDRKSLEDTVALNVALKLIETDQKERDLVSARLGDLKLQKEALSKLRDQIIIHNEGVELVDLWKKSGDKFQANPLSFKIDDRNKLNEISKWYSYSITEGKK